MDASLSHFKFMTQAKMETAADRYRRIKAERLKGTETEDFESPSGMIWKLRKPDLMHFVTAGLMPAAFMETLNEANTEAGGNTTQAWQKLSMKDQFKTIEFMSAVVRYCAVEPRIVEYAKAPDEIGFDEVEMDDYNAIVKWALPGGEGLGLNSFRK